jgi:hypothetical protein
VTYAQRLAANLIKAVDSAACDHDPGDDLEWQDGLLHLRQFMRGLYADLGRRASLYDIPDAPETVAREARKRRTVRKPFEDVPTLLYTLGLLGDLRRSRGTWTLRVDANRLADRCDELRVANAEQVLDTFADLGLETTRRGGTLTIRGPLAAALKVFTDVARLYVTKRARKQKDERVPPGVFYAVDLRIMERSDRKVRLPRLTVADVVAYLTKRQAGELLTLSDHVEALGYRGRIRCADVIGAAFRASYVNRASGKTLFGFSLDHGVLSLRLSFGNTRRVLPFIERCNGRLRDEILRGHCARCGGSGCGKQVVVTVDGAEREICHFGIFTVREWDNGDLDEIKRLLDVGAELFEKEATDT